MNIPKIGEPLAKEHLEFLEAFAKSCRWTTIAMLKNSQSGHPGGSLSSMDFLAVLYTFIISQTGEDIIISNGHISPGVYSILAELGWISKQEVIETFRKRGSIYEGHITRHVPGILYGTGPLGIGVSVGTAFALARKIRKNEKKVFMEMGDGESQEGQVHEMIHFARKYELDNVILFIDYNEVQLSDSLKKIMPIDVAKTFEAGGWEVLKINGHDYGEIWTALAKAYKSRNKPVVILCHTIMGKGIDFMEEEGKAHRATWHGNAPKPDQADKALEQLKLSPEESQKIEQFLPLIKWKPEKPIFTKSLEKIDIDTGSPIVYSAETLTDCRTAYGKALLDLAKRNPQILALTADLEASVMTKFVHQEIPERHIECGIAEQHMISLAGGLSLTGFIPFASTFGAFMSSRAKDQARVNDINQTNVKMVATHCGLSVGEDGPTHQAIDDMGSFLGLLNTMIIEPADPNQTDHIIRYIASHYGNFYVRMGRHKFPIITKEDGNIFYSPDYVYSYGKSDIIREGNDITVTATGAMVHEALMAWNELKKTHPHLSIEIVAVSSIKKFDATIENSVRKTKKLITVEDHNAFSGLGMSLVGHLAKMGIHLEKIKTMGVEQYQLSGKAEELYHTARIDRFHIQKNILELLTR